MYQMYNILFASMPIMWYSVFDFEKEKEEFLSNPSLYEVGLNHQLFGRTVFWQWFTQGTVQALILMQVCYFTQNLATLSDGKLFDFWLHGQVLYLAIVLVANMKILGNMHNFHVMTELLILSMLFNFLAFYLLESEFLPSLDYLYGTFGTFFSALSQTHLCLLLCASLVFTVDRMFQLAYQRHKALEKLNRETLLSVDCDQTRIQYIKL
jgi:magnesium-transporting ATPase (P-type)